MRHVFSVEMKFKMCVKSRSISNEDHEGVFFEVDLWELKKVAFVVRSMLEVRGTNNIFRVDLGEDETRS